MLFYKGLSEVKDDILGTLKVCFSFDEDFNYDMANPNGSYLKILDGWSKKTRSYPCVVISNSTIKPKIWGIGKEFRQYISIGGTDAKEYGGSMEFTITFDCGSESISEREQLADRLVSYLWWIARGYLEEGGIIVKAINSSGETETDKAGDKIFVHQIAVECWVEWTEIISHDIVESINIRMQEVIDIQARTGLSTSACIKMWTEELTKGST